MKLVDDWRKAHRWFSVQMQAIAASLAGAWLLIPKDWQDAVPKEWLAGAALFFAVATVGARIVSQDEQGKE